MNQARNLGFTNNLAGDEKLSNAAAQHHLSFCKRRDTNADRTPCHLPAGNLDALVCLRMRTQRNAALARKDAHLIEICFKAFQIEDQRGCWQIEDFFHGMQFNIGYL